VEHHPPIGQAVVSRRRVRAPKKNDVGTLSLHSPKATARQLRRRLQSVLIDRVGQNLARRKFAKFKNQHFVMNDSTNSSAQASEIDYQLHTLGWKAFQQLCVTIASELWGQTVQGYFEGNDGGRDGAFYGVWTQRGYEKLEGTFTAQCKFSAAPNQSLSLADLSDELAKARRLASRGLANNYIVFTNLRLTGRSDEDIVAAFEGLPGIKKCLCYGSDRITQFIRESPRLRMLVPRVYGLGDLSQILDERAYNQAREILSAMGDDLSKFVITNAYRDSAKAIVEHGFVLLLGEPASGKSAIAAALALGAIDEWGCSTLKIRDANEFVVHSNPNEPKQFFWVDDAFGATQLDWQTTVDWNKAFAHIRSAIRRGARFVFTSRDYIYRNARNFLKESALPVLNESQVVIRVEQLTKDEREQILYNHIRLGTQLERFKYEIKPLLTGVAANERFSPELARRLGHPAFTKGLRLLPSALSNFVENPVELLKEIIRTLDAASRSAIALVFMRGGMLASPITLSSDERRAIDLMGAQPADVLTALVSLDGSLLILIEQQGGFFWRFKHPTIRDAFAALVAENRELMDIYLTGTPVYQLLSEISCGDTDFEGVKVKVPSDRFDILAERVEEFYRDRGENEDAVERFLAFRCGKDFLLRYFERNPTLVPGLYVMSYFYASSKVDLINRIHEFGLLPVSERLRHVASVRELAVRTPDSGFLNDHHVSFISDEERRDILQHVRAALLPQLDSCIESWRDNYSGGDDPSSYFSALEDTLRDYGTEFAGDAEVEIQIADALAKIESAIGELTADEPDYDYSAHWHQRSDSIASDGARSIFDDVDQ
jgi:hypothetical protein